MCLVIRNTGSTYIVLTDEGQQIECRIKGNFRIKGIRTTNPVAVGDRVDIAVQKDGTAWITKIEQRKNYIIRRATNLSKQGHIIAANIDLTALIITINHPVTSLTFIDRFLATAEAYNIPACLIINKSDLYNAAEIVEAEQITNLYQSIGYPVYQISAVNCQDSDLRNQISEIFAGKTVLLSGNSGVGKSTLLNTLLGEEVARTQEISAVHDTGMHTTTFSQMYPFAGGWIIDTPGIKGFGTLDMKKTEIDHYFPDIFRIAHYCKYDDCLHIDEPQCAVLKALENGTLPLSRYRSYLSVLDDYDESKYRY